MYRSRRRPVARRRSSSGFHAAPLVAFLLIACFGILFAGCGSVIKGPQDEAQMQDDTFTADDVARFQDLAGTPPAASGATAGSADAALPRLDLAAAASGSAVVAVDPALARRYAAIRGMPAAAGGNAFRVTNEFLNLRATPDTGGAFVERLNKGDMVELVSFINASWAKVRPVSGKEGFVSIRYIAKVVSEDKLAEEKKAYDGQYYVNYRFVNVRKAADVGSEKIGEIPGQALVKPLSVDKDWARVTIDGKEGFASMQFLAPFQPSFLVRQDTFHLPILRYAADQPGMLEQIPAHVQALRAAGAKILTMRDVFNVVLLQDTKDTRIAPKSVVLAVTGVTPENVQKISALLYGNGIPATLFIETQHVGVSGISEKTLQTLQANGFDLQSAGHTGDDLRALTNAQVKLELEQSRGMLEEMLGKTVFAVEYPLGGVNDRVMQKAEEAGYLFGVGSLPETSFTRDQFLKLPSITVTSALSAQDVVHFLQ